MSNWISVDDRLPIENKQTMRYIELNITLNSRTVVQGGFHYGKFYVSGTVMRNVTHWMPLPAPPKQERRH